MDLKEDYENFRYIAEVAEVACLKLSTDVK